jgi:N6-adenosine-specific RNA methylase IME4
LTKLTLVAWRKVTASGSKLRFGGVPGLDGLAQAHLIRFGEQGEATCSLKVQTN